jgi:F0F1-type ATP synthase assembly protein I
LSPIKGIGAVRYEMANTDKLLLICIIGMIIGFIIVIIDVQKTAYKKGVRDGYHRGRSIKGRE